MNDAALLWKHDEVLACQALRSRKHVKVEIAAFLPELCHIDADRPNCSLN